MFSVYSKNKDIFITVPTLLEGVYVVDGRLKTTECVLERSCLPVERALSPTPCPESLQVLK